VTLFKVSQDVYIHFIGIGGIGMSGIAEVLLANGLRVSGSDLSQSPRTEKLKELGADIFIGHSEENAKEASVIVYSSAITIKNPEYAYALENDIPLMRRAEMLAELMRLKKGIAIAGTHGKTTTTSFMATILEESRFEPTYIIGGIVANLKGHAKVGKGEFLIAEADESDGSFLLLNPIMSVITNIDNDHLDHYGTFENLKKSFTEFANKVPFYGHCAVNVHDENIKAIRQDIKKPLITFGISDGKHVADFEARNIEQTGTNTQYDLYVHNEFKTRLTIQLPGEHNILNSLGAVSLAVQMDVSYEKIEQSISKFIGVGRRFEKLYESEHLMVIDDYGHHPTEIEATLKSVREIYSDRRIVCIFEPHRYSRTRKCWLDFVACFNDADELMLGPIYPASEEPIEGITSKKLAEDINSKVKDLCVAENNLEDIFAKVETRANQKEEKIVVISLGAGSIGREVREWVNQLI
jgi:UDP-N-acetylmuramate--alanine ligase